MAYVTRYRLEFDTIKGRQVKLDIEEERDLPPASINHTGSYIFEADDDSLYLPSYFLTSLKIGDLVSISGTSNNGNYTIKNLEFPTTGFVYTKMFFNEPVTDETSTGILLTFTTRPEINLIGSTQTPVELSYPNGEFEKMNPIRESKMRIKILTQGVNYEDFTINYDTQFKVKLYINNTIEWSGWLDNDYITEPFLDVPVELELSANDGLSILKTMPLQTQANDQMWGLYKVKEFIANALYRTNLNLDFVSFINIYPNNVPRRNFLPPAFYDNDAFSYAQIYATTFLKGPRDFDDCYQVLSKIMQAFGCTLYQARGKWHIVQTNDRIAGVLDGTIRDYTGAATNISMNQSFKIDIGLNEITKLINADALVSIEKPFKEVAIKHKFDVPPIYFRNFDLLDRAADAFSGVAPAYWTAAPTNLANFYGYVNQGEIFVDLVPVTNAEIRRGLKFRGSSNTIGAGAKQSSLYPVNGGDIINIGFSVKYNIGYFRFGRQWVYVLFVSESGQQFYLDADGKWYTAFRQIGYNYHRDEDRRFWKNYTIKSIGVPGNGTISIIFTGDSEVRIAGAVYDVFYKDLEFNIDTSFNEMNQVEGFENICSQNANIKNKFDNEIFLSNAPNISTQGSLLSSNFINSTNWQYKDTTSQVVPYAKYITRAYWRTMYRQFMRIEGRLFDLYQGGRLISPLNTIEFTEIQDKEFMLTTLQIDIRQESAEFTMIELRNTLNNNDFTQNGIETFRYLNVKAKDEDDPIKEPKTPIDWKFGTIGIISSLMRRQKRRRFNNYS